MCRSQMMSRVQTRVNVIGSFFLLLTLAFPGYGQTRSPQKKNLALGHGIRAGHFGSESPAR